MTTPSISAQIKQFLTLVEAGQNTTLKNLPITRGLILRAETVSWHGKVCDVKSINMSYHNLGFYDMIDKVWLVNEPDKKMRMGINDNPLKDMLNEFGREYVLFNGWKVHTSILEGGLRGMSAAKLGLKS